MNTLPSSTCVGGALRQVRVQRDQPAPQRDVGEVDARPLGLVHHDGALQRREHRDQPLAEHGRRGLLQAQAQHRAHVAEEIHQRRRVAPLAAVLLVGEAHHRRVVAQDHQADERVAGRRREPGLPREQRERHDRPDEAHDVLQVDELVLRKAGQRLRGAVDAMQRLARVVALVPRERQRDEAAEQRVGQRLAHAHARSTARQSAPARASPRR